MAFTGPARQRRVTVLFRLILVIPHYFVVYVLTIAAEVVAVIGWFAALFTGRLPTGLADFLVGWLRWYARFLAYLGLLTDQYPPFALADADYPVRLSAAPGRLNRLAVFFRLILAIPASILLGILGYGVALAGLVIWLIVLIAGSMPEPLHQAVAATVRFAIRFYGYFFLMSGTYPAGLFGDPADADAAAVAAAPAAVPPGAWPGQPGEAPPGDAQPGPAQPEAVQQDVPSGAAPPDAPPGTVPPDAGQHDAAGPGPVQPGPVQPGPAQPGPTQPGPAQPGYAQPEPAQPGYAQPGYAQPPVYGEPPAANWPTDPRAWLLVLSRAAKRLVVLFIVLGVIALVGITVGSSIAASQSASTANAANTVSAAHVQLSRQLNGLSTKLTACRSQSDVLACVTKLDRQAAQDFGAFASTVRSTPVPSSAAPAAAQLATAADQVQSAFQQLGAATSPTQYEQIDSSTVLPRVAQFNAAYQSLIQALGAG
jgi:hypothetical protein